MNDDQQHFPTPERIQRRALALTCVAYRANMELDHDAKHAAEGILGLREWLSNAPDVRNELEQSELEAVETQLGEMTQQQVRDGTWRAEGIAALGWALSVDDFPDFQVSGNGPAIARALGFLSTPLPPAPARRADDELTTQQRRQFSIHWRLREFQLRRESINYLKTATTGWIAHLMDITDLPLSANDLAIDGAPIALADPDRIAHCLSIARERHHAMNWLVGEAPLYSDVDTST